LEPKVDGVAVSLTYEDGLLVRGATRGDGRTGDDITQNLRTIHSIPLSIPKSEAPGLIEIRGEVYMPVSGFTELNRVRTESGQEAFANPRNAAAGSLKLLDPAQVARRPLDAVFYALGECRDLSIETHEGVLSWLQSVGLTTFPRHWRCDALSSLENSLDELFDLRN
ncbi:MAG: NAD-dependent DNA ligase LigA, partial [Nitrospinaceae bacterium]|nr:NAD-dependent DNA ligase LigA [Nitrospinaceae bacterium]